MSSVLISSYVAYLLNNKKLNRMMSSYQIMRNTLLHLSEFRNKRICILRKFTRIFIFAVNDEWLSSCTANAPGVMF